MIMVIVYYSDCDGGPNLGVRRSRRDRERELGLGIKI